MSKATLLLPLQKEIVSERIDTKIGVITQSQFEVDGFLQKQIISPKTANEIAKKIEELYINDKMLTVSIDDKLGKMKFNTINGEDLLQSVPIIEKIYQEVLDYININLVDNKYAKIESLKTAVSVNRYDTGGTFREHFDRHEMTVAIMIQKSEKGGELVLYPFSKIRIYNDLHETKLMKKLQYILDKIVFRKIFQSFLFKKHTISLKNGEGVFFYGTHTIHKANQVYGTIPRITLLLAYDLPYKKFNYLTNYYGDKDENI